MEYGSKIPLGTVSIQSSVEYLLSYSCLKLSLCYIMRFYNTWGDILMRPVCLYLPVILQRHQIDLNHFSFMVRRLIDCWKTRNYHDAHICMFRCDPTYRDISNWFKSISVLWLGAWLTAEKPGTTTMRISVCSGVIQHGANILNTIFAGERHRCNF